MNRYLCVLLGGGFGSVARYLVNRVFVAQFPQANFAVGTFVINVTGSFFIGLVMTLLTERYRVSLLWQLLLVTGFLGGYTTFSSFEYDGYLAARGGRPGVMLLYFLGSVVLGYAAVWLGVLAAGLRRV